MMASALYTDTLTTLVRGPYLQQGAETSVIIRWRTAIATSSKVDYGLSDTSLTNTVLDTNQVIDHIVLLDSLSANTVYYYSIGSSIQVLQGDTANYFKTSPPVGVAAKTTIWATGDCGTNTIVQKNVRDRYLAYMNGTPTNLWLLLGDNSYDNGLDSEYQFKFFNIYGAKLLKQTVLWPAPGNHDYANNAALQISHAIPYYDIFSLPTNAEVGGYPSSSESFYSFNYANIHFVSLDSYGKEAGVYRLSDTLGPQTIWLKQDLAANTQKWTIVYWHHPPYTMGSHNSDTEVELKNIRSKFIQILERYKVDLVLCGHSHDYERSKLMEGHYGLEATFDSTLYDVSTSSALYDGSLNSCPYIKNSNTQNGTVYAVAGSAGRIASVQASFPHSAMYYSYAAKAGSMAIEVDGNKLTSKFVCADGVIRDQFTILKDVNKVTDTTIVFGQTLTLTASWVGSQSWSPGLQTTQSITVTPDSTTTYVVTDSFGCLADTFKVKVCYPPVLLSQSTDTTLCDGSNTLFYAQFQNTDSTFYQWQMSADGGLTWMNVINDTTFSNSQTDSLSIAAATMLLNGNLFRCIASDSCSNCYSLPVVLNITPLLSPFISISASPAGAIYVGDTVVFTATALAGGANPSYQWFLNGVGVGTDTAVYSNNTLNDLDSVWCVLTSTAPCVDTSMVSSNNIVIAVNINVQVNEAALNQLALTISPNPIMNKALISFNASTVGEFKLDVVDLLGKPVASIAEGNSVVGRNPFTFDATALGLKGGMYFVQLHFNEEMSSLKFVLIHP